MDPVEARYNKLAGDLQLTLLYLPSKSGGDWIYGVKLCPYTKKEPPRKCSLAHIYLFQSLMFVQSLKILPVWALGHTPVM